MNDDIEAFLLAEGIEGYGIKNIHHDEAEPISSAELLKRLKSFGGDSQAAQTRIFEFQILIVAYVINANDLVAAFE